MSHPIETNLDVAARILRKIDAADPAAKAAILKRMQQNWQAAEESKNTLKAFFTSKAFWEGVEDGFTAPFKLIAGFFHSKPASATEPQVLHQSGSFDSYTHDMCVAIRQYLVENPDILEKFHLNDKERALLNLQRSPIKWDDENAYSAPKPQV